MEDPSPASALGACLLQTFVAAREERGHWKRRGRCRSTGWVFQGCLFGRQNNRLQALTVCSLGAKGAESMEGRDRASPPVADASLL